MDLTSSDEEKEDPGSEHGYGDGEDGSDCVSTMTSGEAATALEAAITAVANGPGGFCAPLVGEENDG